MSSTYKTTNLGLNQFVGSDRPQDGRILILTISRSTRSFRSTCCPICT